MSDTNREGGDAVPLLALHGITKRFSGVAALENVRLDVRAGEIHALCGENGAGKSTLMKVVSGVYPHPDHGGDYGGELRFEGETRRFAGIADSERLGIIIIHQELALVPQLSIAENLFLGHEPSRFGVIDRLAMHDRAIELLARVGLRASPQTPVAELGVGQQQLVEIAKALAKRVRLLILDEPTASLNETDSDALLDLLLELKSQGIACILISHKLKEVTRVADRLTVLRDGRSILSADCDETEEGGISESRIIQAMVGRDLAERYPPRTPDIGEVLFELRDWHAEHPTQAGREVVKGVNLTVRRGEIVGIAGLMGAGRTELAMSVFGRSYGRRIRGSAWMDGREVDVSSVPKAIAAGLAYVTEDRKSLGLLLEESIAVNTTLAHLAGVSRGGVLDAALEHQVAQDFRRQLGTRCAGVDQRVMHLSGGNQQKVVLAKWLFAGPRLLILDEPTRGIDVGAKYEIYSLIAALAARGCGILLISSEMPELLGMCDRLHVMNEGRLVAEFPAAEATQARIMGAIVGAGETADV
ncbi:ATP-binding cassette domain-containing protein [Roseateles sp. So40a]|uniref:ATP-binding cassette domain-containing protein n=1 Tax=Roseateles sp. So40a TaxID=3400226 RepID=UPI003A851BDA